MANLSKKHVTPCKPFSHTGINYAGLFQLIRPGGRNRIKHKVYVAVFVCFATKVVHLELVYDFTIEKFLVALIRFISRHGISAYIHSDNGTMFVGPKNKLN